ncbi:methionyl-tRNA formyltransferase, mitochondrial isoform X2 [Leptopilina boulardi]|nr:methionyl-tRNA formyltransferase, mitochondrial isoform X2 [Leptopilina boulardi]
MKFDIGVVVSFGHLIPSHIIDSFPLGMINVHGSLLPRWRGSAPIIHALKNGDTRTGISIMRIMPKKFDIGDIIAQEETSIDLHETQPELYKKLALLGSKLLLKTMEKLPEVLSSSVRQNEDGITYAPKIKPDMSFIKWKEMNAKNVYDLNRALTGLYSLKTNFNNKVIKIFGIQVFSNSINVIQSEKNEPGTAFYHKETDSLIVKCKDNTWVSIKTIGVPGKPKLSALNFANGFLGGKRQKFCIFTT